MLVADGIYLVQLPLPYALRSVNCYVLRDGDGWTVVDAGLNYPAGQTAWKAAWTELGFEPSAIKRIILTHAHPDHIGMAGWLAGLSGAEVFLPAVEALFAQQVWGDGKPFYQANVMFFQHHGMSDSLGIEVYEHMAAQQALTHPLPKTVELALDSVVKIGSREFRVIETRGHSDGHVVLFCEAEHLMLCGDTVLNKITPNISLWPYGRPNPLADFFETLDLLEKLDVQLALPGHGSLIRNFRERIGELRKHHDLRLAEVMKIVGKGSHAFAVCSKLFSVDTLSPHQLRFAMAETLAHLEYLVVAEKLALVASEPFEFRPL
jgi:glyoxylase-like metal-dependent hydrolase (beta-lactamase superfamily II)